MKKIMLILFTLLFAGLTGCASTDHFKAVEAANKSQEVIAKSYADAEIARYQALGQLAQANDPGARVAAAMGLAMGSQNKAQVQAIAPQPMASAVERWAAILVNPLTSVLGMKLNSDVAINASNNATTQSLSQHQMMLGFGQSIQGAGTYGYQYVNPTPVISPGVQIVRPEVVQPTVVQIPTQVIEQPEIVQVPQ